MNRHLHSGLGNSMETRNDRLYQTEWEREGESFTGDAVAARLVKLGARNNLQDTMDELLSVPVGGAVNTGVSAYIRTA